MIDQLLFPKITILDNNQNIVREDSLFKFRGQTFFVKIRGLTFFVENLVGQTFLQRNLGSGETIFS